MKKFLLFWLLLCSSSICAYAYNFAVNSIYYDIESSADMTVSVTYKDTQYGSYQGAVIIPDTVEYYGYKYRVTKIGYNAFKGCNMLNSIKLPKGLKGIDGNAFEGCSLLRIIVIPSQVQYISNGVFKSCSNLVKLNIPSSVKSIESNSFNGCTSLTEIIFEDGDDELNLSTTGNEYNYATGLFYYCKSLKNVYIGRNLSSSQTPILGQINFLQIGEKVTSISNIPSGKTVVSFSDFKYNKNFSYLFVKKEMIHNYSTMNNVFPLYDGDVVVSSDVDITNYLSNYNNKDKFFIKNVYFCGDNTLKLTENELKLGMNPNCLFYVIGSTTPEYSNFVDYETLTSKSMLINAGEDFYCTKNFIAKDAEITYSPSVWADGQSGWEVITLPFEPTSIEASVSGSIVPITTNSKGNFWLRQYVGSSDDAVYFTSTSDGVMKANTPYLIAFPGDKMGKGSLEGQTITFKAKNVTIPVTTIPSIQKNGYTFVGNYDKTADEGGGWTLNAEGSAFVWSETVGDKPFSGYFKGEAPVAGASALRMSFGQMDNTTGLEQNMAELIDYADEVVYTLDGRKVIAKDLKPGLYIKNNKKMMVR